MKKIVLAGKSGSKKFTLVDDFDYEYLRLFSWYISHGYVQTKLKDRKNIRIHQLILPCIDGYTPDHINRDKLDNRRENLRRATMSQQAIRSCKPTGSSKYRGVSWHKQHKLWIGYIKDIHLGYFKTEEEAARAYNKVAKKLYGEFAVLNDIE
jgi:hypothetical protein